MKPGVGTFSLSAFVAINSGFAAPGFDYFRKGIILNKIEREL